MKVAHTHTHTHTRRLAASGISGSEIYMPSLLLKLQRAGPRGSNLSRIVVSYTPRLVYVKVNLQSALAPFSGFVHLNLLRVKNAVLAVATTGRRINPSTPAAFLLRSEIKKHAKLFDVM